MISRFTYRLKGDETVTLDDLTSGIVLNGPNGSGKTAFLNSLQLALTGKAYDVGLRDSVAAKSRRSPVLATTAAEPFSEIELDELGTARWEQGESLTWSGIDTEVVFPWQEAESMLTGGAVSATRFFAKRFPGDLSPAPAADRKLLARGKTFGVDSKSSSFTLADLLESEKAVAKALKGHNDRMKALRNAADVVRSCRAVGNSTSAAIVRPLAQLMQVQLDRKRPTCVTCGEAAVTANVEGRLQKVTAALDKAQLPSHGERDAVAAGLQLEADALEGEASALAELLSWIQSWLQDAVAEQLPAICEEVNAHLPTGYAFRGAFHGRQFLAGFRDGEGIRMAYSGGEGQLLLAAICSALSIRAAESGALPVTTTGDRWLDEGFLRAILGALQGAQGIRVVTAVNLGKGRPPGGWSILKFPLG
tara:strand:+ start:1252 stop:2511 length:1260 start_codon:yes stop_codon:yes gene_type:complete